MRLIFLLLLSLPLVLAAQKEESFARLVLEDGTVIRGASVTKPYERQIPVYQLESNSSANSTTIRFTMNPEAAVNTLRDHLRTGRKLLSGVIELTYISLDRRLVRYRVNMEDIRVEECADANGQTTVQLHATRIGWTYYSYTKSGQQSVLSKNGWDEQRNSNWTNF